MTHADLNQDEWDTPHEFEGVQLPEWPKDAFPELAQTYVNEVSRSTETPIELPSMLFLSSVATASQKIYIVEIRKSYREPVNLYVLTILPPASRKSNVFGQVMAPICFWEEQKKEALESILNAQISRQKILEERIKQLRRVAANNIDNTNFDEYQKQIISYEKEFDSTPSYPRLWTSDITPEHLGALMAQNDEAMAILSDEGAIFDILGGLYSNGRANIDILLQAHSGGSIRVDRKSKPPVFLKKALLTIGLTVQPEVIKNACKNKTLRGRGLLGRFLYVIPPSNIGHRTLEEKPMEESIRSHYHASIIAILNHPHDGETNAQHVLKLDPEAYSKWLEYSKMLEMMMGPELDYLTHITDWAGKLSGQIARIAALLHIYRHAFEKPWETKICLEDMQGAVKIGHALIKHALRVFNLIYEDDSIHLAKEILQWINNSNLDSFSHRECLRKFRKYDKTTLQPGLNFLKKQGYLHEWSYKPPKGAPSVMFDVNPNYKNKDQGQKGQ